MGRLVVPAARRLADDGIDGELVDLRTIVQLDWLTIVEPVARTGWPYVVDEYYRSPGRGGAISVVLVEELPEPIPCVRHALCGAPKPSFASTASVTVAVQCVAGASQSNGTEDG